MVMKAMRRGTKPIIWIVAAAFLGTIFLAWGMNLTSRPTEKGIIGQAGGQDIRDEQYRRVMDYMYYQHQQQNPGQELTESDVKKIRDDAFNTIVNDILFAQERRRLSLELPDIELVEHLRRFPPDFLRTNPSFTNEDGAFDYSKYQQAMNDPQLGQFWAQVEDIIRPQLQQHKLQEYVTSLARVTDPEIKMLFEAAEEKRKVRYVGDRIASYASRMETVDSSAVEAFYESHMERYYKDEMVELDYVRFYKSPSTEDTAVVLNELTDLRRRLDQGEDFAELARIYSNEPSAAETGGDLGWFGRNAMVAAFDSAAFALEPGTVSEPVLTRFGYHIIKVHEKRQVNDSDQVHASHILMKIETSGRTLGDLRLAARQFIEDLQETPFDSLAKVYNLQLINTGKFERGADIRGIGKDKSVEEFAFRSKVGAVSDIIEKERFYAVCKIKDRFPAGYQPLSEVWSNAMYAVKLEIGSDSALGKMREIQREMDAGKTLAAAAEAVGLKAIETDYFGRYDRIPGVGPEPEFRGVAFSLTPENPISPAFKASGMYCIIEYLDQSDIDLELFTEQRDSIFQTIYNGKQGQIYQAWFEDLYERKEVEDYRYQISDMF